MEKLTGICKRTEPESGLVALYQQTTFNFFEKHFHPSSRLRNIGWNFKTNVVC